MVSTAVMNYLMEVAVISFVLPVVFLIIWRLRTKKNMLPALAGVIMYLLFARLLEMLPNTVFAGFSNPVSDIITSHAILSALYFGLAAAVFEETGRYLAFRYFLPKYTDQRETAVTYGIGHGGVECIFLLGWSNLQYYIAATVFEHSPELSSEFPKAMIDEITALNLFDCVLDGIITILFFLLQIALSILVLQAYRNPAACKRLLGAAMLLHMLAYLPNGLYRAGLPHVLAFILMLLVFGFAGIMAWDIYKKMGENEKKKEEQQRKKAASASGNGWNLAKRKLSNLEEQKEEERGR